MSQRRYKRQESGRNSMQKTHKISTGHQYARGKTTSSTMYDLTNLNTNMIDRPPIGSDPSRSVRASGNDSLDSLNTMVHQRMNEQQGTCSMRKDRELHTALTYNTMQPNLGARTTPKTSLRYAESRHAFSRLSSLSRPTRHSPLSLKRTIRHSLLLPREPAVRRTCEKRIIHPRELVSSSDL